MKLNLDLLIQLYKIEHPTKQEYTMISFILNYLKNVPNVNFELDHYNNLFITRNTNNINVPCIVAHMDCVLDHTEDWEVLSKGDNVFGRYVKSKKPCALGCDDANGICCALQLIKTQPDLKILFTTEEEIGGFGANEATANSEFFKNVLYLLQADRRGNSDLITFTNGIPCCSNQFIKDISDICDKYGYGENTGTFTDIGVLAETLLISGVNISCGYKHEHTPKEFTDLKHLQNCLNFMEEIINNLDRETFYTILPEEDNFYFDNSYKLDYRDYSYYDMSVDICKNCKDFDCMRCKYGY